MLLLIVLAHAPLWLVGVDGGVGLHPEGGAVSDRLYRMLSLLFVDSRAYPLFAALFGYGLARVVARRQEVGMPEGAVRRLIRRRGRWLLVFGLVHALAVTPVEILGAYGLLALALSPLLFRSDRTLLRAAGLLAAAFLVIVPVSELLWTAGDPEAPALGWLGYSAADLVVRVISWMVAVGVNAALFPIPVLVLLGAWAGRQRVLEKPERHARLLRRVALVGLPVSVLGALPVALAGAGMVPLADRPLFHALHTLTGVGGGLAYASLFGLLSARRHGRPGPIAHPLAAAGRRSLTTYLLQSTLLVVLLSQTFLGLGSRVHSAGAALVAIAAWAGAVSSAVLLERTGKRGPADVLLRRLADR